MNLMVYNIRCFGGCYIIFFGCKIYGSFYKTNDCTVSMPIGFGWIWRIILGFSSISSYVKGKIGDYYEKVLLKFLCNIFIHNFGNWFRSHLL